MPVAREDAPAVSERVGACLVSGRMRPGPVLSLSDRSRRGASIIPAELVFPHTPLLRWCSFEIRPSRAFDLTPPDVATYLPASLRGRVQHHRRAEQPRLRPLEPAKRRLHAPSPRRLRHHARPRPRTGHQHGNKGRDLRLLITAVVVRRLWQPLSLPFLTLVVHIRPLLRHRSRASPPPMLDSFVIIIHTLRPFTDVSSDLLEPRHPLCLLAGVSCVQQHLPDCRRQDPFIGSPAPMCAAASERRLCVLSNVL